MKFTIDKHEKYILFSLNEENLNSLVSPLLKSELILINAEGQRNIILDLTAVKNADSSGLSSLLVGQRLCKNADGVFIVAGLNKSLSKLILLSQLDKVITIVPKIDEAIDLIFMEEIEKELRREI